MWGRIHAQLIDELARQRPQNHDIQLVFNHLRTVVAKRALTKGCILLVSDLQCVVPSDLQDGRFDGLLVREVVSLL